MGFATRRIVRVVVSVGAFLAAAVLLQSVFGTGAGAAQDGTNNDFPDDQILIDQGADIWGTQCALCHGELGRGVDDLGPSVRDAGTAAIDFYVRTGRMPLEDADNRVERSEPHLTEEQRFALLAFYENVISTGVGPDIPEIDLAATDVGLGRELFVQNCAACHGPTAAGIAVGQRDVAPALDESSPIEIAEAIRVGPGRMPVFGDDIYTEDEVEAVTAWVLDLRQREAPGGAQIGRSGPVFEGAVAWILGMGVLLIVVYLLGERAGQDRSPDVEGENRRSDA